MKVTTDISINASQLKKMLEELLPFMVQDRNLYLGDDAFKFPRDRIRIDIWNYDTLCLTYSNNDFSVRNYVYCNANQKFWSFSVGFSDIFTLLHCIDNEDIEIIIEPHEKDDLKINVFSYNAEKLLGIVAGKIILTPIEGIDERDQSKITFHAKEVSGDFLASTLRDFVGYCRNHYVDSIGIEPYIWYFLDSDGCTVMATTGNILKTKRYNMVHEHVGRFGIAGALSEQIADWAEGKTIEVICEKYRCRLFAKGLWVSLPITGKETPDYVSLLTKFKPKREIIVLRRDLLYFIANLKKSSTPRRTIYIHSVGEYTFLHNIDESSLEPLRTAIPNANNAEDKMMKFMVQGLETILKSIGDNLVSIAYDPDMDHIYSISAKDRPCSVNDAQLIANNVFDDDLSQIRMNEDFLKHRIISMHGDPLRFEVIKIGEKFTRHQIPDDGCDHLIPVITSMGVDVVLSLSNISDLERTSYTEKPFSISLFETETVPFIILGFENNDMQEFALNVMGMPTSDRSLWLSDEDMNLFRLFLVEAETGTLLAVRTYTPDLMRNVKDVCRRQLSFTEFEIKDVILKAERMMSIQEMCHCAQTREIIPKPEVKL